MSVELLNGFYNLKDAVNERVVGDIIPVVTDAVDQAIAEHNKVTEDMLRLFVHRTTLHKIRYKSPVAAKLQPLDHEGRARKIKAAGHYDLAFPIREAGIALGETRITRVKMTVKEVNDRLAMILDADKRWLRDQMLNALLRNTSYTFVDDEFGDLTVVNLANGDSVEYLTRPGNEAGETANHYRAVTAMDDANQPFATIYTDLTKRPENFGGGKVISFIPTNLESSVKGLTNFIETEDPDIRQGANTAILTGNLGVSVPGEVLGKVDRNWIVRWDSLPDNYVISVITSGERPLAMREHPEAELQGFQRVREKEDSPYFESEYQRYAGFAGWNRVGAIVTKVDPDATYDIPTDFAGTFSVS